MPFPLASLPSPGVRSNVDEVMFVDMWNIRGARGVSKANRGYFVFLARRTGVPGTTSGPGRDRSLRWAKQVIITAEGFTAAALTET